MTFPTRPLSVTPRALRGSVCICYVSLLIYPHFSFISYPSASQSNPEKDKNHLPLSSPPRPTSSSPAWKRIQRHVIKIRTQCRSTLCFHVGRCPAFFFLFGLTTPISPGSVSVCFTVTWITGLGRFRASIIMATLSGTVLLFLLDEKTREEKFNDKETGRQRERERDGEIMEAYTSLRITITFRGNHPTFMPSLTCFDTKIS